MWQDGRRSGVLDYHLDRSNEMAASNYWWRHLVRKKQCPRELEEYWSYRLGIFPAVDCYRRVRRLFALFGFHRSGETGTNRHGTEFAFPYIHTKKGGGGVGGDSCMAMVRVRGGWWVGEVFIW